MLFLFHSILKAFLLYDKLSIQQAPLKIMYMRNT